MITIDKRKILNLISNLKPYIIDSQFSELNIFSKQYFADVLLNMYSDNSITPDYTLFFMDLDRLRVVNDTYGFEKGSEVMQKALSIFRTAPFCQNALLSRIGGDEFCGIIENKTVEECQFYENELQEKIHALQQELCGVGITMSFVPSKDFGDASKMFLQAEENVRNKKRKHEVTGTDTKQVLQEKMEKDFDKFLSYFRFPENNFSDKNKGQHNLEIMRSIGLHLVDALAKILKAAHENEATSKNKESLLPPCFETRLQIPQQDALGIHQAFTFPSAGKNLPNTIEKYVIPLEEALVKEPITGQFNNQYLQYWLSTLEPNRQLNVIHFSIPMIKLSNELHGHPDTDSFIRSVFEHIQGNLGGFNYDLRPFKTHPNGGLIVNQGGGDFLFLIDKADNVDAKEAIAEIPPIEKDCPLSFVYATGECFAPQVPEMINQLKNQCDQRKIAIKESKLMGSTEDKDAKEALTMVLQDCVQYYQETNPNWESITEKKKLMDLLFKTALNVFDKTKTSATVKPRLSVTNAVCVKRSLHGEADER